MLTLTRFKQTITLVLLLICTIIVNYSCVKRLSDQQIGLNNLNSTTTTSLSTGADGLKTCIINEELSDIVLGTPKQNPYTLSNMQAAYQYLLKSGVVSINPVNITTTHYYVKFKPQNIDQYKTLEQDTTIMLSDYPIESNVILSGNRYHDPSLPDSVPTYQYTAVKVGYQFADNIPYEIIENLYIPEEDKSLLGFNDINKPFVDKLLDQAYIQTNNFEDVLGGNTSTNTATNRYNPGGRIRIFDTRLNTLIGLEGVTVTARRWFTGRKAFPDYNGNYRMDGSFDRPCNYSLHFTRPGFSVMEHYFGLTHFIDGPKQTADWNVDIMGGYDRFVGHIFRGAFRYYYKNIGGLKKSTLNQSQEYIAKNGGGGKQGINWGIVNLIKIWRDRDNNNHEWNSDELFSTVCHETAHSTNYGLLNDPIKYAEIDAQERESWAVAVELYITHLEYSERGIANYGNEDYTFNNGGFLAAFPASFAYQYWNPGFGNDPQAYTNIYIDIVDNFNELGQHFFGGFPDGIVDDRVHGYTLPDIENNMLKHIYGRASLATELKNHKPAGVTDADIDRLINFYN